MFLVGYKNRILVMFHWAWSWLTFQRGARLITGEVRSLPAVRSINAHGEPAVHHGASTVSLGIPSKSPETRDSP
jgi:NADH dehydrogenase